MHGTNCSHWCLAPTTGHPGNLRRGGTLVIAPVTLLGQWRDEIEQACRPEHRLKVCTFYGAYSRTGNPATLASYDVVLTSPGVASKECGECQHQHCIIKHNTCMLCMHGRHQLVHPGPARLH
jgi:hypothetical protein